MEFGRGNSTSAGFIGPEADQSPHLGLTLPIGKIMTDSPITTDKVLPLIRR
jgi:hypothetical protein